MRHRMNDETRANLRKLWLRVLVVLFSAFGLIVVLSWLAADTDEAAPVAACPASQVVCTEAGLAEWLGFALPLSATDLNYASASAAGEQVWVRFDVPAADVPNFIQQVDPNGNLSEAPSLVDGPPAAEYTWWTASDAIDGVYVDSTTRAMTIRIDQRTDTPWTVFIAATAKTPDE